MLVAQIADQLGNQMFAYASVKSIAQKKGVEFHFIRQHNTLINDNDPIYGNEIHTVFPSLATEFLTKLPEQVTNTYEEPPLKERISNYQEAAMQVKDDTLMVGHYISCRYFKDNLEQLYTWFTFPSDINAQVSSELKALYKKYPDRPLVAVHFRVGKDYKKQGFRLRDSYWFRAAEKIVHESPIKPVFLLFYDQQLSQKDVISQFRQKYDCKVCRGSLVHDLYMMSRCRIQIICNSSFSIMSAVLNQHPDRKIYRPSVHPVGLRFYPTDCYMDDWTVIPAERSMISFFNCLLMHGKGKLLKLLRSLFSDHRP